MLGYKLHRKFPSGIKRLCCDKPPLVAMSTTQKTSLSTDLALKLFERWKDGNAFAKKQLIEAASSKTNGWICRCSECGVETMPYAEREQAVNVWNIQVTV